MGDRIAVLERGKLCQVGTPTEIYGEPGNTFVARFLGAPPMNLIERNDKIEGFRPENFLKAILPISVPGILTVVIFAFTLTMQEFVYGLTFISSSDYVPRDRGSRNRLGTG